MPWIDWVANYALVRDAIEATLPDIYKDFNKRFRTPGGFARPIAARNRVWKTETGKANFIAPQGLDTNPDAPADGPDVLQMMTVRSDDQFNTTIYSLDDRFRGVYGTRKVVLMNRADMARLSLPEGSFVTATTAVDDGELRQVHKLRVTPYDIPEGCVAGYYPECNPLLPLAHHAEQSKVPAGKSIPVRLSLMELTEA
ncbi:MAG: formate dehydrogenase [Rhizobacter sp.]|nr:formate dehydrogenase [Rhizobacter sp.]